MKFIHFGCWNNGLCNPSENNGLTKMTTLLNKYIKEQKDNISFISIDGDNYYPDKLSKKEKKEKKENKENNKKKEIKIKLFNSTNFTSGFSCLPISIPKIVLFGNHEIEDNVIDLKNYDANYIDVDSKTYDEVDKYYKSLITENKEEMCKSLLLHKDPSLKLDDSYKIFDDVITILHNNTLIIMFDTTIYTFNNNDYNKKISDTCYQYLFNNFTDKTKTISDLLKYQEKQIKVAIEKYNRDINNIIFIGHHPIATNVRKETKDDDGKIIGYENKVDYSYKLITFFNSINKLLSNKTIYYLCADTHFYQQSEIQIGEQLQINQYIVGTGGADLDQLPEKDTSFILKNIITTKDGINVIYDIDIRNQKKTFGFLTVDIQDDNKIAFKFHDTNEEEEKKTEYPEVVNPVSVHPASVQPASVQPASVQPASVQPASVQPASVQPTSVQPTSVQPTSVQPTGGYFKKYLKYKAKYLYLKQNIYN